MAIITISRGTFSGGQILAERIAEKLGYRCINREILSETARKFNVQEEKLYESLIKKPGFFEGQHSDKIRYLALIRAALCKEAKNDNLVYHGHAGHLLLKGVNHLIRVRVVASMEFRIKAAMERNHLNREEAIDFIDRIDKQRAIWTRFLYHENWEDPSLYDIVLNLDHFSIESASDIVCHMAGMKRYQTTSEAQKVIDDLVVSSNVEAVLATHKEIADGNISIEADGDAITIFGTVDTMFDADKVRIVAREIPGVAEINSQMKIRLPILTA